MFPASTSKFSTLLTVRKRHAAEINWKDFYWQMALGGAQQLVLGLHNRGTFDDVQKLPIVKVPNDISSVFYRQLLSSTSVVRISVLSLGNRGDNFRAIEHSFLRGGNKGRYMFYKLKSEY